MYNNKLASIIGGETKLYILEGATIVGREFNFAMGSNAAERFNGSAFYLWFSLLHGLMFGGQLLQQVYNRPGFRGGGQGGP